MRVKEWFIKNLRTIAMFLGILLAISIIGVVALRFFRNAKLIVMATPLDATIKINGAKYHNGNHIFFAGKVTVEISKDGFDTQKYEVELKSGQTATVYAALSQSGDYKWYTKHPEDYEALKLIGTNESKDYIQEIESSKQIISVLPLHQVTMLTNGNNAPDGKPFYETVLTNGTSDKNCRAVFCLKIKNNTGNDSVARKLVEDAGFKYDNYGIIYE